MITLSVEHPAIEAMTPQLAAVVTTRDALHELLMPAAVYSEACRAERIDEDLLAVQTLPLDLVLAGFKVAVHRADGQWHITIERQIDGHRFHAVGRGVDYPDAFRSLNRVALKSLERLATKVMKESDADVAA